MAIATGLLEQLCEARRRYERQRSRNPAMVCRVGEHLDCAVLKLQKPSWTNDDLRPMANETGIFFSVWITAAGAEGGRAEYNIHSLKLRQLRNYRLTSIDFCKRFRAAFDDGKSGWPNVSTDHGPLTLMQGWIAIERTFAGDVLKLMNRFDREVVPIIDELLKQRTRPRRAARSLTDE